MKLGAAVNAVRAMGWRGGGGGDLIDMFVLFLAYLDLRGFVRVEMQSQLPLAPALPAPGAVD